MAARVLATRSPGPFASQRPHSQRGADRRDRWQHPGIRAQQSDPDQRGRRCDRGPRSTRGSPATRARRGAGHWASAWSLFPGQIAYVWHGALHATTVAESLTKTDFSIRAQIIWAKERLVMGRGDYHWQHEPCWYAVRSKGHWTGDRKQTTLWSIPTGGQDAETEHATQKPVECMRRPMLNNSNSGQAVYEPFLGSGTTLLAAETIGRVCLAIELEARYADVAVRRWQAFTGKPAVLESTGQRFDEVAAERGASMVGYQANVPSARLPAGTGQIDTGG